MFNKIASIRSDFKKFSVNEKLFLLFAMICTFLITSEYAVTKPSTNSIFLSNYSVNLLPYAWLATVPINFLVVSLYNRFLPTLGNFRIFFITIVVTIGINTVSAFYMSTVFFLPFITYVWKDIYILLMFQQLWSLIHTNIQVGRAKYMYGIMFGIGGVGSILGTSLPGFFAVKLGSENLLLATIPLYLLFLLFYFFLLKKSEPLEDVKQNKKVPSAFEGFSLIRSSRVLTFILLIVIFMQVAKTMMDYQFNTYLEKVFLDQDVRTQFSARIWGLVNSLTLCFQLIASFIIIQFLGIKRSHIFVPATLFISTVGSLLYPGFIMVTCSFTMLQIFDYSIFNIIKEMLYVPLKSEEKFQAKAIIDVFAYRTAKALASLLVIALQFYLSAELHPAYLYLPCLFYLAWIVSVSLMMKEERGFSLETG